jgi:hypothetical protein
MVARDHTIHQEAPMSLQTDTESIEAIVTALYEAISRESGAYSDWERMRPLLSCGSRIIPPSGQDGLLEVLHFEAFQQRVDHNVRQLQAEGSDRGFHERELAKRIEHFGSIAHVWSSYASRYSADDPEPFTRGINSFQLAYHRGRWWVMTILWDIEREDNPIPEDMAGYAAPEDESSD